MTEKRSRTEIELISGLPPSGKRVLISWITKTGYKRISLGFYAAKYSISADDWDDPDEAEFDSKGDCYVPEGWYEETWEGEVLYFISGDVLGWAPQPILKF